jgi:hypothetical protein
LEACYIFNPIINTTNSVCIVPLQVAKSAEEGSKKRRAPAAAEETDAEPEPAAAAGSKPRKQSASKAGAAASAATAGPQQQSPRRSGRSQRARDEPAGPTDEDGPAVSGAGVFHVMVAGFSLLAGFLVILVSFCGQ